MFLYIWSSKTVGQHDFIVMAHDVAEASAAVEACLEHYRDDWLYTARWPDGYLLDIREAKSVHVVTND